MIRMDDGKRHHVLMQDHTHYCYLMNVEFVVYIYHMLSILIYGIDDQLSQR